MFKAAEVDAVSELLAERDRALSVFTLAKQRLKAVAEGLRSEVLSIEAKALAFASAKAIAESHVKEVEAQLAKLEAVL